LDTADIIRTVASPPEIAAAPTWEEMRSRLIPNRPQDRWDEGELPHAILHLDDHAALRSCALLLRLTCVQRRSLDGAMPSREVALREVVLELLPQTLDHPCCAVLRVLAGLEPGSAGRRREERQRLAGDRLGPPRHPATPRTVRRRVKADCWPWLLDRLIELETKHRRALDASAARLRSAATPQLSAVGVDLGLGLWADASPEADVAVFWLPVAMHGGLVLMPVRIPRRTLLKAGGAALLAPVAGLLDVSDHERVAAVVSGHSRPDMDSVGHFEALLAHFRKLDDLMGPRCVHGAVQSTVGVLDGLCDAAEPRVRQVLLSVCAQYDQLDAWMWLDRGGSATARRGYDRALARATESGNQPLAGYVLACKAKQAIEEGNPGTAVALASEAQSGKWALTPAVDGCAAELEARAWAISGEGDKCERKLDDAARLLARSSEQRRAEEPPWIYYFGEERLPVHRGICYARLGRADAAISLFDEAIANLPGEYVRDRAFYLFWSAQAYAHNNDPEQAATVAHDAVQILIDAGSDSVLNEARKLHARLDHAKSAPAVRKFGDLLQATSDQVST
jgi:tetratricopeptide (TPR) repeat protein